MQWKHMDWPVMVDSLNLLEVSAVPITLFIDEQGIVRAIRPSPSDLGDFLNQSFDGSVAPAPATPPAGLGELEQKAASGNLEALQNYADSLVLWGGESRFDEAIRLYQGILKREPNRAPTHFRLGVAYRKRYDSRQGAEQDFQKAVRQWGAALDLDPNQYIWRRRIQQYGPRLEKPYSFYDWVQEARKEIEARGEDPVQLTVEPGGAEFAYPAKHFEVREETGTEPDPGGRILRDERGFVQVNTVAVPAAVDPGGTVRVHLTLRPNLQIKAHWNNEVDDLVVWVRPPPGWQVDQPYLKVARPPQVVSQEVRKLEFELKSAADSTGSAKIPAYALYYVCEDVDGTCLYRRQDISILVTVK